MKTFGDYGIDLKGRTGAEVKTVCPKCSQARKKKAYPCLNVNTEKGVWHCWHCEWAGSLQGEWQAPKIKKIYAKPKAVEGLSNTWRDWLNRRGITNEVMKRNKISSGPVYMPQIEAEADSIQFPYFASGDLVNIKYRDMSKNFRMHAGAQRVLYGIDDIKGAARAVIVEGEIDKLSAEVADFKACVSVPDGAPSVETKNYESKFDYLETSSAILAGIKQFVIAVDNDAPGRKLQDELVRRLGAERCFTVSWPEGCKDANDTLIKHGPGVLHYILLNAKPCPVAGIFSVEDIYESIIGLYEDGAAKGKLTGWASVDPFYTVREGEWTVITGIPGHGKSEWLDALMVNLARNHDWKFSICSPENQPLQLHFSKISEKFSGKPFHRGSTPRMDYDDLGRCVDWVNGHFSFILPEEPTLDCVLELARVEVFRRGIKGLVIDPWNELDHSRPSGLTETEYISQSLSKIRRFARSNQVHVWVVAHPTKLIKDKSGKYPIPTPYDISGSAHWRNKADNAITVWREIGIQTKEVQVHVQKVRFKQVGKAGAASLQYDTVTGRYFEQDSDGYNQGEMYENY